MTGDGSIRPCAIAQLWLNPFIYHRAHRVDLRFDMGSYLYTSETVADGQDSTNVSIANSVDAILSAFAITNASNRTSET
jgi:hypothetical protein